MTEDELWNRAKYVYELERRRALPIARLEATIRNALGGKPKAGEGGTVSVASLWSGEELLPDYALPLAMRQMLEGRELIEPPDWLTVDVARAMETAAGKLKVLNAGAWLEVGKIWRAVCLVLDRAEGKA